MKLINKLIDFYLRLKKIKLFRLCGTGIMVFIILILLLVIGASSLNFAATVLHLDITTNIHDPIEPKYLVMPSIVFSSVVLVLINYIESARNNRETVEWKQREQTVKLLPDFEKATDIYSDFMNLDKIKYWWELTVPILTKNQKMDLFNQTIKHYKIIHNECKVIEPKEAHITRMGNLRILNNIYETMATQYHYELVDQAMFKKLYKDTFTIDAFNIITILRGYLGHEGQDEFIKLLQEWNIDYTVFPTSKSEDKIQ